MLLFCFVSCFLIEYSIKARMSIIWLTVNLRGIKKRSVFLLLFFCLNYLRLFLEITIGDLWCKQTKINMGDSMKLSNRKMDALNVENKCFVNEISLVAVVSFLNVFRVDVNKLRIWWRWIKEEISSNSIDTHTQRICLHW
jgi:hypothetical protein